MSVSVNTDDASQSGVKILPTHARQRTRYTTHRRVTYRRATCPVLTHSVPRLKPYEQSEGKEAKKREADEKVAARLQSEARRHEARDAHQAALAEIS